MTPTSNPELAHAMRELRKSNAAQPHLDRRKKRRRTRQSDRWAHIKEHHDQSVTDRQNRGENA